MRLLRQIFATQSACSSTCRCFRGKYLLQKGGILNDVRAAMVKKYAEDDALCQACKSGHLSQVKHNTQFLTVVRKYRGDTTAVYNELKTLLGKDVKMKQYQGRIEILGDHRIAVHSWLRRLGF